MVSYCFTCHYVVLYVGFYTQHFERHLVPSWFYYLNKQLAHLIINRQIPVVTSWSLHGCDYEMLF